MKVAIVFVHDAFGFEVWLSGSNRKVQEKYWKLFKENKWNKYHLATNPLHEDYVAEQILIENPDFGNLNALTRKIEKGTVKFIKDVESFLSQH